MTEPVSAIAFYAYLTDGHSELRERFRRHVRDTTSIAAVDLGRVQKEVRNIHAAFGPHNFSALDRIAAHLRSEYKLESDAANQVAALMEPILFYDFDETRATVAPLFGIHQTDHRDRKDLARELLGVAADPRPILQTPGRYVLTITLEVGEFQADVTEALARGRIIESSGGIEIPGEVRFPMRANFADPFLQILGEFEHLINSARVKEADIQRFFNRHPEFLYMLGSYDDVTSQVTVKLESVVTPLSGNEFRPDFFLRNSLNRLWDVLDIKPAQIQCKRFTKPLVE